MSKNSYLMQFYEINIYQSMIFRLNTVHYKHKIIKIIDILVILDGLCGRGSWSEHRDQLLGVNNALKDTKMSM